MTATEIKNVCIAKHITFIPHHPCECCGEYTGWYLLGRWPPYEVAYSGSCGCSYESNARPDTWQSIADWVNDENGSLRGEYAELLKMDNPVPQEETVTIPKSEYDHLLYCKQQFLQGLTDKQTEALNEMQQGFNDTITRMI